MDLKIYYQKIREIEAKIVEAFPVVASGTVLTEVTRAVAAKLIVEGLARLATIEETKAFRELNAEAKRQADQATAAAKMHLSVLSTSELEKLKSLAGSAKKQA
jgi:hypothetical protein